MSEKTLKCDNIRVSKKEFNKFKQPINLSLVNVNQIKVLIMVLIIFLVTKKMKLLNHYVLFYLK